MIWSLLLFCVLYCFFLVYYGLLLCSFSFSLAFGEHSHSQVMFWVRTKMPISVGSVFGCIFSVRYVLYDFNFIAGLLRPFVERSLIVCANSFSHWDHTHIIFAYRTMQHWYHKFGAPCLIGWPWNVEICMCVCVHFSSLWYWLRIHA